MNQSIIVISVTIFIALYGFSSLIYLMFRQYLKFKEKEMLGKVSMDEFRSHLERQLIELNQKFMVSEKRWQEVNNLVLSGQRSPEDLIDSDNSIPKSQFLPSHGIALNTLRINKNLIFVLTPFQDEFKKEYEVVARVGRELGFEVNRGDEYVRSADIFPQLLRLIVEAKLIVANISGRNPNVFYELGIAHALDKPVILIAHRSAKSDLAFDIQSKQIIFYENELDLEKELLKVVARILRSPRGEKR